MTSVSIITIGDELLIGQVIDTNSAWMAQQLNKAGMKVTRRVAVGDNRDDIWNALDEESVKSDIILLTGGLGPTADDITKPLLCEYFNGNMTIHQESLEHIIHLFTQVFKRPMTERNRKQAEVPDNCRVFLNKNGTAPCMWFEKEKKVFVSMPGVPFEMKSLMETAIIPELQKIFVSTHIAHRTLVTHGIGESMLADLISDFEDSLPVHVKLAYLPNYGLVRLRLTSSGTDKMRIEEEIDSLFTQLQQKVSNHLLIAEDATPEKIISKMLAEKGKTIATAESCTGGYISHLLTSLPGASSIFEGSAVTYSYKAKEEMLHVKNETLITHGAVSAEVVTEMAKGLLNSLSSDYVIAVSGIMGPNGGTPDKPVGTVWVAVGNRQSISTSRFHFRFDRTKNIQLTAMNALLMMRKFILESES